MRANPRLPPRYHCRMPAYSYEALTTDGDTSAEADEAETTDAPAEPEPTAPA